MDELVKDKLHPNANELLSLLSEAIDDTMLREIAEEDYGEGVDLHFDALTSIRDEGKIPVPMKCHPREVLELIRWSEPNDPNPGGMGKRGHLMRAFCCAVLLRAAGEPGNKGYFEGENQTLVQLLASLKVLEPKYEEAALRFLVWRLDHIDVYVEERPFFLLGILLLCLKVRPNLLDSEIDHIADCLVNEENTVRTSGWAAMPDNNNQWLLGLTFFDQRHSVWLDIGEQLFELGKMVTDKKVREHVAQIAEWLTHNKSIQPTADSGG